MTTYSGKCYCGAIHFMCEGEPFFTQHCHCNKCREVAALSKRPNDRQGYGFTAAYLTSNFHITAGLDHLNEIIRNNARLYLCKTCSSLIYGISIDPTKQAGIGINANNFIFEDKMPVSFHPVRHIWYQNRIIDMADGLPKYKDAPVEQFGSGELCEL